MLLLAASIKCLKPFNGLAHFKNGCLSISFAENLFSTSTSRAASMKDLNNGDIRSLDGKSGLPFVAIKKIA